MLANIRGILTKDVPALQEMLARIKEFNQDDLLLAMELVQVFFYQPEQKDYEFSMAVDEQDRVIGYACYGPTPLTDGTYDLYWIAVDPVYAGKGIGTRLLKSIEEMLVARNARLIVIETSSDQVYGLTRQFYLKNGYALAETIKDFFRDGEDRVTFVKKVRD